MSDFLLRQLRRTALHSNDSDAWRRYALALERIVGTDTSNIADKFWITVEWLPTAGALSVEEAPPWNRSDSEAGEELKLWISFSEKDAYLMVTAIIEAIPPPPASEEDQAIREAVAQMRELIEMEDYTSALQEWNENPIIHECFSFDSFEISPRFWVFGPFDATSVYFVANDSVE